MPGAEPLIDFGWLAQRLDMLAFRTLEHVWLTVLAVSIGFAISFALALFIRRQRAFQGPVTATTGLIYSVPSLALFGLLVPLTGLSLLTAQIALVGYTLLILVRNIVTGLDSVPPDVREAADGLGYTSLGRLWRVELPIALPVIIAGLRIATVSTVGLVTVAALIGQGGLGFLIVDGLRRFFPTLYITAAVLSVMLAVAADVLFVGLQRLITPWLRARTELG
jgi:osmoprotectant transport system permease protein